MREGGILEQDVDRLSGEPACLDAGPTASKKKENVPGVFYRLPRLVNRASSVSSSFPSGPRLGGTPLLRQGRQWLAGECKVKQRPHLFPGSSSFLTRRISTPAPLSGRRCLPSWRRLPSLSGISSWNVSGAESDERRSKGNRWEGVH